MRLGCRRVASPFCLPAPPFFLFGKVLLCPEECRKKSFFSEKKRFLGGREGKREREREESERGKKKEGREGERERGGSASAFWRGKNAQGERASSILQELGRIALEKAPGADPRRRREPQISVWKWPVAKRRARTLLSGARPRRLARHWHPSSAQHRASQTNQK